MILVCGEALVDLFVSVDPVNDVATEALLGGSPFNVAVGLSRLGARAAFFGGISTDPFGQAIGRKLAREGVALSFAKKSERLSTISVVATDANGQPSYAFHGEGKADRDITQADLPGPEHEFEAITVGSYTLAVPPVADALLALVQREAGRATISLDPNVRPTVTPDIKAWRSQFEAFLPYADIIKASEEDLRTGYGTACVPEDLIAGWLLRGPRLVVLTRGVHGASAFLRGQPEIRVDALPVKVADTVGAGDSFHAALLASLSKIGRLTRPRFMELEVADLRKAMNFAIAASSITCSRKGADLPTESDILAVMQPRFASGGAVRPDDPGTAGSEGSSR
ncbi:carbohydrate kinase family protein [Chelatococcus asaccharovorans]|uniref:carbohydrate kinase family protein n=1 Tax=Chelatococcus asaccharovorans TaxID=28210 RepID=UPI00224C7416|nr:carbohydrate kinase [Chelatococcus asaccharovorans]CAH1651407.1 Fructokinase [Chelatococcus asaccharovorans]CAH1692903.1 Fructokinase [Chelatococcus asaccharovorans]